MTKPYYAAILLGLLPLLGGRLSQAGDHQFRAGLTLKHQLNNNWEMVLDELLRYRSQKRGIYYQGTDLGLVYSGLAPWIDLGFKMKLAYLEDSSGHWLRETRPQLDTTLKHTIHGITVSDRSRLEYRTIEDVGNIWRYRNKLKVQPPWEFSSWALKPYGSGEVFFGLDGASLYSHRFSGGVTMPITPDIKGDIYALWQEAKIDYDWHEGIAFGLRLVIFH